MNFSVINVETGETTTVTLSPEQEAQFKASYAEQARSYRTVLLTSSDWTQVADAPVDQAAWATYRQALRDVPQQAGFPTDVVWPTPPA